MIRPMAHDNDDPRLDADGAALPTRACPFCGWALNGAMEVQSSGVVGEAHPRVGDYAICYGCAALLVYGDGMVLREATLAEHAAVAGDDETYHAVMQAKNAVRRERARDN